LGDLLVKAGIVSQKQLDEAVQQAGGKHLNVGQMLIVARYITARDLQAAVDAQSSLRDRVVDMNTAIRGLKAACRAGIPFAEAVRVQDPGATKSIPTNKLGELLLEANIIDGDQFGKALQRSLATGLPLGRILVLNGAITETLLTTALEIQVRVRDEMLTRHEAIDYLKATSSQNLEEGISAEKSLKIQALLKAPRKSGIRLGELLVLAGVLGETDVMNALELGLVNDQPIGQILVAQGFVSPELLESALRLQDFVDSGHLAGDEAAERLRKIHESGVALSEVVSDIEYEEPPRPVINFQSMLTLGRVVSEDDFQAAFDSALTSPQVVATVLMMTGYMDEGTADATLKCHTMILDGYLSQEDALVALDYCLEKLRERPISYEGALQELGWSVPPELLEGIGLASFQSQSTMSFAVDEQQEVANNLVATGEEELHLQQEQMAEGAFDDRNGDALTASDEYADQHDTSSGEESESEEQPDLSEPSMQQEDWSLPETLPEAEEMQATSSLAEAIEEIPLAPEAGGELAETQVTETDAPEAVSPAQGKRSVSLSHMKETARQLSQSRATQSPATEMANEGAGGETAYAAPEGEAQPMPVSEPEAVPAATEQSTKVIHAEQSDTGDRVIVASSEPPSPEKQARKTRNSLKSLLMTGVPAPDQSNGSGAPKPPHFHTRDFAEATIDPDAAIAAIPEASFRVTKSGELELTEEEQVIIARASSLSATPQDMEAAARIVGRKQDALRAIPSVGHDPAPAVDLKKKVPESEFNEAIEISLEKPETDFATKSLDPDSSSGKHKFEESGLGTFLGKGKSEGTKSGAPAGKPKAPSSGLGAHIGGTGKPKGGAIGEALSRAKYEDSGLSAHLGKPKSKAPGLGNLLGKPKSEDNGRKTVDAKAAGSVASLTAPEQENASEVATTSLNGSEAGSAATSQGESVGQPDIASLGELSKVIAPGLKEEKPFVLNESLIKLAQSYYEQGRYTDAENLYIRILDLRETAAGPEDSSIVGDLNNLAGVLCVQGKFKEAESHVERAVGLIEKLESGESLRLADSLNTLAGIYYQQDKYDQCEALLSRALGIRQKLLGEDHQDIADNLRDYAKFLRKINRSEEAEKMYTRAREIVARGQKRKGAQSEPSSP
jgi:tetratricopeptide (TPR) repeat protein